MGYVVFIKIFEDESYVIYSYSHDSNLHDGKIKIRKGLCDFSNLNSWADNFVEITLSETDKGNHFAMRVVVFLAKVIKDNKPFPDKHMLAYG